MHVLHAFVVVVLYYTCELVSASCDAAFLSKLNISTIGDIGITYLQKGSTVTSEVSGCGSVDIKANLCRLTMQLPTSNRSITRMDVWLPDKWDGRYVSTGNGGLAGCIDYGNLGYLTGLGLAAGGANGGHDNNPKAFGGNIEVVKDYSYRSTHIMTVTAKNIVKAYYGTPQNKAYYYGCSTGGRQGLQSAQMFPADFDGISAGACAADFNHLTGWSGNFYVITGTPSAATFVTLDQWEAVHFEVMKQCDGLDGVNDSIIEDPDLCNFNIPTYLLCSSSNHHNCLTQLQATTVQRALSALRDSEGGLLYPAIQPGAEADDIGVFYNGKPNGIPSGWYQWAIFNNPNWDPATLNISNIVEAAQLDLAGISTWNGDLSQFRDRGGKLLTYHGLKDSVITSANSRRYYRHVSHTMNLPPVELDKFYRFFRISGMGHCGGGEGAWQIYQGDTAVNFNRPSQNVLFALIDWVENGIAPDTIQGTKFKNDNPNLGISFQRNHCRYPFNQTYTTGTDSNQISSWNCDLKVDNTQVMSEET